MAEKQQIKRPSGGRPRAKDRQNPLCTKVNQAARQHLKKLAADSGNSQIAVLEHIIIRTKKVPKLEK